LRAVVDRYRACALPPVMGAMKRSNAISGSAPAPRKRSISAAGRRSCSTGGMNAARAICQNALVVKSSRHYNRQRTTVRRSTPTALASSRIRRSVTPCCIIDTSTTMVAR
jgi:hypothetical protein